MLAKSQSGFDQSRLPSHEKTLSTDLSGAWALMLSEAVDSGSLFAAQLLSQFSDHRVTTPTFKDGLRLHWHMLAKPSGLLMVRIDLE